MKKICWILVAKLLNLIRRRICNLFRLITIRDYFIDFLPGFVGWISFSNLWTCRKKELRMRLMLPCKIIKIQ